LSILRTLFFKRDRNFTKTNENVYNSKPKHKKKSEDQCELNGEINEKFESNSVKKLVKTALGNQKVKQEYEGIKKRVDPIDIPGNKVLIKGYVVEIFCCSWNWCSWK